MPWGLRPDPYDPDAVDADGDGIVQEGTAFERPAGTRIVDRAGRAIERGLSSTSRDGYTVVDSDGKPVRYTPTYGTGPTAAPAARTTGAPSRTLMATVGSIGDMVGKIGDMVGTTGKPKRPETPRPLIGPDRSLRERNAALTQRTLQAMGLAEAADETSVRLPDTEVPVPARQMVLDERLLGLGQENLPKPKGVNVSELRWREMPRGMQEQIIRSADDGNDARIKSILQIFESNYRPPAKTSPQIVDELKQMYVVDQIMDRPEMGVEPSQYIQDVTEELSGTYGDLGTRADFRRAFTQALRGMNATIEIPDLSGMDSDYGGDDDPLISDELGALMGHLWVAHQFPEAFRDVDLTIGRNDRYVKGSETKLRGGAEYDGDITQSAYQLAERMQGSITHDLGKISDPAFQSPTLIDTVSGQIVKRFLSSEADGMSAEETERRAREIENFWVAVHETVHMAHHRAARRDLVNDINERGSSYARDVTGVLENQEMYSTAFDGLMFQYGVAFLETDIETLLQVQALERSLKNSDKQAGMVKAQLNLMLGYRDPDEAELKDIAELRHFLDLREKTKRDIEEKRQTIASFADHLTDEMREIIVDPQYGTVRSIVAAIAFELEDQVRSYAISLLTPEMRVAPNRFMNVEMMNGPVMPDELNERLAEIKRTVSPDRYPELEKYEQKLYNFRNRILRSAKQAQFYKMFRDDLSDAEWKQLRQIWSKVSAYASDRHSLYSGQDGLALSHEGVAEAITLAISGGMIDPEGKSGADDLIKRLMNWLGMIR